MHRLLKGGPGLTLHQGQNGVNVGLATRNGTGLTRSMLLCPYLCFVMVWRKLSLFQGDMQLVITSGGSNDS